LPNYIAHHRCLGKRYAAEATILSCFRLFNPNDRAYLTGIGDSESGYNLTLAVLM
jgi:hypothetical protein